MRHDEVIDKRDLAALVHGIQGVEASIERQLPR
jgi:hypothetical protein